MLWMDLAYDNDSQGAFGLGWLFFCMFELIGRVVSETTGRGELGTASRGAGHGSLFFAGSSPTLLLSVSLRGEGVQIEL